MSKARSMYAGSSGSNYGVNKNSPGNGNGKWQGLWPSVGHARNARYINTRAGGDNRDVVFCMNQLGGVGRISNMFATTADGVQDCKNGCILPSNIKHALQQLSNYAYKQGLLLGLAGVNETVQSDLPKTSGLTPFIRHFPSHLQRYVGVIDGLGLEFQVTTPNDVQKHVVVMLTKTDAEALKAGGFGFPVSALCDNIIAYGATNSIVTGELTTENSSKRALINLNLYLTYPKEGLKYLEESGDPTNRKWAMKITANAETDPYFGDGNPAFPFNTFIDGSSLYAADEPGMNFYAKGYAWRNSNFKVFKSTDEGSTYDTPVTEINYYGYWSGVEEYKGKWMRGRGASFNDDGQKLDTLAIDDTLFRPKEDGDSRHVKIVIPLETFSADAIVRSAHRHILVNINGNGKPFTPVIKDNQ